MMRFFYFILPVILLFAFISNAKTPVEMPKSSCLKCHEETYMKAISNPYQHSVIQDSCKLCHKVEEQSYERNIVLRGLTLQTEGTVFLGDLEDNKKYRVSTEVLDYFGKKSTIEHVTIEPLRKTKFFIDRSPLKHISDVKLHEVKKGMFVQATVSWSTDAQATSEIEYRESNGKYRHISSSKNLFTLQHKISLKGLKHKNRYSYRIISRDMNGTVLKSSEYSLDTTQEILPDPISEQEKKLQTLITSLRILKVKDESGMYLKIETNKLSQFMVWIKEIDQSNDRPCKDFKQTRFSTIDVCLRCHPQDSSHPVGVRSKNPKIVVSNQLPTIENGIITCVSCHFSHGGKKPYFVRMDFTQEICVKCHQSYYDK